MSFTIVSEQIKLLLDEFEVKDLPNLPNIAGIFEQSELTFAIVSGSVDGEYLNLSLNVSVACQLRFDAGDDSCPSYEERKNLDSIVFGVIYKLHRKKLIGCGLMRLQQFENFTPESGKWRSLLTFEVPLYLKYESLEQGC
jgi:hypothetical protein